MIALCGSPQGDPGVVLGSGSPLKARLARSLHSGTPHSSLGASRHLESDDLTEFYQSLDCLRPLQPSVERQFGPGASGTPQIACGPLAYVHGCPVDVEVSALHTPNTTQQTRRQSTQRHQRKCPSSNNFLPASLSRGAETRGLPSRNQRNQSCTWKRYFAKALWRGALA